MKHSAKLERAKKLASSGDPAQLDQAFQLYDPQTDGMVASWLGIAASASAYRSCSHFDVSRASDLALIAAMGEGDIFFPETLDHLYQYGLGAARDDDASVAWLAAGSDIPERGSQRSRKAAQIYLDDDRRFNASFPNEATPYVLKQLDNAIRKGNPWAACLKGQMYLQGRGVEQDSARGRHWLDRSISYSLQHAEEYGFVDIHNALLLLLAHTLLGTDVETAIEETKKTYQRYESYLGQEVIQRWGGIFNPDSMPEFRAFMSDCVRAAYGQKDWSAIGTSVTEFVRNGQYESIYPILYNLHLASGWLQPHASHNTPWKQLLHLAENARLGVSSTDIRQNTEKMGPCYNATTAEGDSILGVWARAATSTTSHLNSCVPQGGAQELLSISVDENGKIHYKSTRNGRLPAKLLPEDFRVAEALVFGQRDYLLDAGFHSASILTAPEMERDHLCRKVWIPPWLGHTLFGKTLSSIDYLAGRFAFEPLSLRVGGKEHAIHKDMPEHIKRFLQTLHHMSGFPSDWSHWRLMVLAESPQASIAATSATNGATTYRVSDISVRMRIDGEECSPQVRGTETLNDPTYRLPRATTYMTSRYNFLELCAPQFARTKQLFRLLNGLLLLQSQGYVPPPWMAKRIERRISSYEELPTIPDKRLLCRPYFYKFKF